MKRSFKSELFISFFIVALISIVTSGVLITTSLKSKLEYDYRKEATEQIAGICTELDHFIDETEMVMKIAIDDPKITAALAEDDSWVTKKAYNSLYELTGKRRDYSSYYIYDETGKCILSTSDSGIDKSRPIYWGIIKVARTHPDTTIIENGNYDVSAVDETLSIARAIVEDEECVGYVVATVSNDNMDALIGDLYSLESEIVILDEFWDEIYSSENAKESGIVSMLHDRRFAGEGLEDKDYKILFEIGKLPKQEIYIVIGKQTSFTETMIKTMIKVMLITVAASLIICFAVARILSARLMHPLNNMTRAMEKIRSGDLTVRMDSTRQDEFGQLSRDFDDMTNALKVYVELRSKQQQELSDSNIAMMQAQLNPHFLYNTLDTIKWVAKANHIPELATLSSSLAMILRASISPDIFVTLSKEMDFIDHYIEIQRIRFSDSFTFDAEIPIEFEDAIVPKLILQPIVENAIVHGLKDRTNGHIFLNAYERNGRLVIYVEDDGCGMDDEMLRILNTRDSKELKGHIGFYNVDAIIRLHYGLNYGLHAENVEGGGARITMELPLKLNAED